MLIPALVAALALSPGPPVDTTAVYAAVLQVVREEHPDRQVVLSETLCEAPRCTPHFEGVRGQPMHPAERVRELKARGLVRATCRIPESTVGCSELEDDDVLVGFAPVRDDSLGLAGYHVEEFRRWPQTEGDVWVTALTVASCRGLPCSIDASAYMYLLRRNEEGTWKVLHRLRVWVV